MRAGVIASGSEAIRFIFNEFRIASFLAMTGRTGVFCDCEALRGTKQSKAKQ
jgi:hypothetical protein